MINNDENKNLIVDLIAEAHTIAVIPSKVAGANAFCAAVALYYMLCDKEKEVYFVYTGKVPDVCDGLIKKDEITGDVDRKNLVVSIDYSNTPAAKVHYSTDHDVLTLVVTPVSKDFDKSRVKSNITGYKFDLIIMVGVQSKEDLGQVYTGLASEIEASKIINLDNTVRNSRFGLVNIIDTQSDNLSTLVFKKASEWNLVPGSKAAKAMLVGMTYREIQNLAND